MNTPPQEKFPDEIARLVERFTDNYDDYKNSDYKEAELCSEFLVPFFEALGWDRSNRQGHAEAYKDVSHQKSIRVAGTQKACRRHHTRRRRGHYKIDALASE